MQDIDNDLKVIQNILVNEKKMKKYFHKLKIYLQLSLNRIQHTIELTQEKNYDRVEYIIMHDYGKSYIEKLFSLTQNLIDKEQKILLIKKKEYENIIVTIFILFAIEIGVVLYLIFMIFKKKSKMELFQNELENQLDIINSQVPYSKTDLNGVITEVSEAYCNMTLYTKKS